MSTPTDSGNLPAVAAAALFDTPAHAAVTALSITASAAGEDQVRAITTRAVYPLIQESVTGSGATARRRSAALTTLVEEAVIASAKDVQSALTLALERWLLHPRRVTADELVDAAECFVSAAGGEDVTVLERAWVAGAGLDTAISHLRSGFDNAQAHLAVVGAAVETMVPMVWVARELDTTRAQLYRHVRAADPIAWRQLLPENL